MSKADRGNREKAEGILLKFQKEYGWIGGSRTLRDGIETALDAKDAEIEKLREAIERMNQSEINLNDHWQSQHQQLQADAEKMAEALKRNSEKDVYLQGHECDFKSKFVSLKQRSEEAFKEYRTKHSERLKGCSE